MTDVEAVRFQNDDGHTLFGILHPARPHRSDAPAVFLSCMKPAGRRVKARPRKRGRGTRITETHFVPPWLRAFVREFRQSSLFYKLILNLQLATSTN